MTCQNTSASPGTGTATFYVNGVAHGTTANVSMIGQNDNTVAETDLMIGANRHMQTGETTNFWGGYIYWGAILTRLLSPAELMFWHNHPYSILLPG